MPGIVCSPHYFQNNRSPHSLALRASALPGAPTAHHGSNFQWPNTKEVKGSQEGELWQGLVLTEPLQQHYKPVLI